MKKLILVFAVFVSLFLSACNGCNGPSGETPGNGNDTTAVDTSVHDTVPVDTLVK